jgi:hypothetical protein
MSESDLAIVAALVFAWGTLSARLERFDVTALGRTPGYPRAAVPLPVWLT